MIIETGSSLIYKKQKGIKEYFIEKNNKNTFVNKPSSQRGKQIILCNYNQMFVYVTVLYQDQLSLMICSLPFQILFFDHQDE